MAKRREAEDQEPAAAGVPPSGDASEAELVRACQRGDRRAQHILYERYVLRVFALVRRMVGEDEAFDITQDVFVRVLTKIGEFRGQSALTTWIHRVAVNEVLQRLRRRSRQQIAMERLAQARAANPGAVEPDVRLDLDAALAELPEDARAILLLRYQQGLSYAEIAEVLEIPAGTVASRLNRAREQVRRRLRGYGREAKAADEPTHSEE